MYSRWKKVISQADKRSSILNELMRRKKQRVMGAFLDAREQTTKDYLEEKHKDLVGKIKKYEEEIDNLGNFEAMEIQRFIDFAFDFINNLVHSILSLPPKEMQLCKQ